jgi:hypothetical protein
VFLSILRNKYDLSLIPLYSFKGLFEPHSFSGCIEQPLHSPLPPCNNSENGDFKAAVKNHSDDFIT